MLSFVLDFSPDPDTSIRATLLSGVGAGSRLRHHSLLHRCPEPNSQAGCCRTIRNAGLSLSGQSWEG